MDTSWISPLFQNQMIGVLQTRGQTIIAANAVMLNLLDYQASDLINQPMQLVYAIQEEYEQFTKRFDQMMTLPPAKALPVVRWKTRTGTTKWVQMAFQKIDESTNDIVWLIFDNTYHKNSEEQYSNVLARQQALLDNAISGIAYIKDRKILEFNQTFAELFGYERTELLGQDVQMLFASQTDYEEVGQRVYETLDRKNRYEYEQRFRKKDGTLLWVYYGAKPIVPYHSEEGAIWVVADISARKQIEEQLIAERNKAHITLSSIGDAVITTDTLGRLDYMNPGAEWLTGWSLKEAKGKPLHELFQIINEKTRLPVVNPVEKVLQDGVIVGLANHSLLVARDGTEYSIEDSAAPIVDASQQLIGSVLVFHDVTDKRNWYQRMEWQATHDMLTGLPNRQFFIESLNRAMISASTNKKRIAVALLDLDNFKLINDLHGHETGDQLLVKVGTRLTATLDKNDAVARIGGDEFVVLCANTENHDDFEMAAQRLQRSLTAPFWIKGIALTVNVSIGYTVFPDDSGNSDTLLRHIDQAMYTAKQLGKNRVYQYDLQRENAVLTRYRQLQRLRAALQNQEFIVYYQPKVDLIQKRLIGLEALIRWKHPELGILMPGEFLPALEQDPLMLNLGHYVMDTVLQQISHWNQRGFNTTVSINISAQQLLYDHFIKDVEAILLKYPLVHPQQIEMEILETDALKDVERVQAVIQALKEKGIGFSLDDFGTGYSSLAYMKRFPVDVLKIDRSFIVDMLGDEQEMAIVQGIISMAKVFHRDLIAEGIENEEQISALIAMGCHKGQGFWIGRPMPVEQLELWRNDYFSIHAKE